MLIGEFHIRRAGPGMAPGLVQAMNQEERGLAYSYYVEHAAAHPEVICTHWFEWIDEPVTGRNDGENYNIGWIDVTDQPYAELVGAAKTTHARLLDIHSGKLPPTDRRARTSDLGTAAEAASSACPRSNKPRPRPKPAKTGMRPPDGLEGKRFPRSFVLARVPSDMGGTPMPCGTGVPPVRIGSAWAKAKDRALLMVVFCLGAPALGHGRPAHAMWHGRPPVRVGAAAAKTKAVEGYQEGRKKHLSSPKAGT